MAQARGRAEETDVVTHKHKDKRMATQTQTVQRKQDLLPTAVTDMVKVVLPDLKNLLPPDITLDQFRAAVWLELTGRWGLQECRPQSIREGIVKAATYGMLPGRDCHLLPFKSRRGGGQKDATFVPNYFGIILTLERTGKVAKAFAHPVYHGDTFEIDYLADKFSHIPAEILGKEQGKIRFYYGCIRLKDGTTHIEVMTLAQIDEIRKRAPAHDEGPWVTDHVMMSRKTALKRVAKYVRLTPEQQRMLEDDAARERDDMSPERLRDTITILSGDQDDVREAQQAARQGRTRQTKTQEPVPAQVDEETGEVLEEDDLRQTSMLIDDRAAHLAVDRELAEDHD
jgi:recombination protein RecT